MTAQHPRTDGGKGPIEFHYNVYGCFRAPAEDMALAKRAIDAGFEGIWIGDHFRPWISSREYTHNALSFLSGVAGAFNSTPVGMSVCCPLYRYSPPILAQSIATIQRLSNTTFHLGVGVGEALNESPFIDHSWPQWSTRAERLIETLEIMEKLWGNDERISYKGDHYSFDDIMLHTNVESLENIETYWAAWGPQSCQYAGVYADNVISVGPPEMFRDKILPRYENGLEKAGKTVHDVNVTTEMNVNIGPPGELVQEVRERGEYLPDDTELDNPDPRKIQKIADERLSGMEDEEIINEYNISEDPADVVAELKKYAEAGVTRIVVGSNCGDPYKTIQTFEEEIFPAFE